MSPARVCVASASRGRADPDISSLSLSLGDLSEAMPVVTGTKSISVCATVGLLRFVHSFLRGDGRNRGSSARDTRGASVCRCSSPAGRSAEAIGTTPRNAREVPDWHNLFNTFSTRWGHRRRREDAALTAGVTTGLRRGSAHVAVCRRQFGCWQ